MSDDEKIRAAITVRRLSTGYYHIRGVGPCNWAQPPHWPCDEATLQQHTFPEASESFLRAVLHLAEESSS